MSEQLQGKRIAFLVANEGVEQIELTEPLKAVGEAGAEVDLLAPDEGAIQAFNHLDKGDTFSPTRRSPMRRRGTTTAWFCRVGSPIPISFEPSRRRWRSSAPSSRRVSRSG